MTAPHVRTEEFDRFGPWVDEVRVLADVPPLYRDHPLDFEAARLVLKVPRNISRREAHPGMDLYDHLLVLEDERLVVLSRRFERDGRGIEHVRERGFDVRHVPLADVIALRDTVDLLAGELRIHVRGQEAIVVAFNGSARRQVDRLVREIVERTAESPLGGIGSTLAARPGEGAVARIRADLHEDKGVAADFAEAASGRQDLVSLAWHARQVVRPRGEGAASAFRTISHTLMPATLQAAVLARSATTLEVFTRHEPIIRRKKPVHSSSHLIVLLAAIDAVTLEPHGFYAGATSAFLHARGARVEVVLPAGGYAEAVLFGLGR